VLDLWNNEQTTFEIATEETTIFCRRLGNGPPVLLLHGFPQTHLMWRSIAPLLAEQFTVICADLRGYGQSGCPPADKEHIAYSKRVMAKDMIRVMKQFGFATFAVAGHDRGGRVAYRLALDHPEAVTKLAVLDIVPTADAWNKADKAFALDFWPWSLLAQTAPFPEQLIVAAPEAIVQNALSDWGTAPTVFPEWVREAYIKPLRDEAHIHAICEDYRAAATIDYQHDDMDQQNKRKITCPVLALWSATGPLQKWYGAGGGPLAIWQQWAGTVTGEAIDGGHFFPEELPDSIAQKLLSFFSE